MKIRATLLFAFAAISCFAVDPYVGYVYPSALATGTTNTFIVGGQNFWGHLEAWVSGEGVSVVKLESVPPFPNPDQTQRRYLKDWLDRIAHGTNDVPALPPLKPNEAWRSNRWWQALHELTPRERAIVARDLYVRRNPLQQAPSLRQMLVVTLAAAPDAKPGWRQFRVFRPDGVSAPRPFQVVRPPLVEEPLYAPPGRPAAPSPAVTPPVTLAGQILPGETDRFTLHLDAGACLTARVAARRLEPYIGDASPGFFNPVVRVTGPSGREIAFADDRLGYDPDPLVTFYAEEKGGYTFELADRLFRGREDFVYTVQLGKGERPPKRPADAAVGGLERTLEIKAPCTRVFEVFARRIGSKMDARLTLFDPSGATLATWDDVTNRVHVGTMIQDELDPIGSYAFTRPGRYRLKVEDTCARRDGDVFCRLEVRAPQPSFAVYADRSGFHLAAGQRQPFKVFVERREGFTGEVTLAESEDVRFERAIVPAGTNEWTVTAIGKRNVRNLPIKAFDILAVGAADRRVIGARVLACDAYEQAFAWKHLVTLGRFVYKCRYIPPKKKKKDKGR